MRRAHVDAQALYAHRGHLLAQLAGDVVGEEAALPTAREDTRELFDILLRTRFSGEIYEKEYVRSAPLLCKAIHIIIP